MRRHGRWLPISLLAAGLLLILGPAVLLLVLVPSLPSHTALWVLGGAPLAGIALISVARLAGLAELVRIPNAGPPGQRHPALRVLGASSGGAVFFLLLTLLSVFRGGSILAAILGNLPMLLVFVGLGLCPLFISYAGTDPHCRKCGYAMDAETAADKDPRSRCPECGAHWHGWRGTTIGRRRFRPGLLIAGLLLVLAGFTLIPLQFSAPVRDARLALLPTSSLIAEVSAAPRGFTMDEWSALSRRTLTADQQLTLARGLLDLRLRRGFADRDAETWLAARAVAGALPPDLRDRVYRELVSLSIDAPVRARVGQPITVKVAAKDRGSYSLPRGSPTPFILFAGFEIPGYAGTGPDETVNAAVSIGGVTPHAPHPEPCTFTPTKPGPQSVEAEYWIIVTRTGTAAPAIRWTASCEPILPPGIVWQEHRTLQATIEIDP